MILNRVFADIYVHCDLYFLAYIMIFKNIFSIINNPLHIPIIPKPS